MGSFPQPIADSGAADACYAAAPPPFGPAAAPPPFGPAGVGPVGAPPPFGPADACYAVAAPPFGPVGAPPVGRLPNGRFAAGNPGRPRGARSRLVSELEQAMELAAPEIVRILICRAQVGDGSIEAAKYVLERIAPTRRGRLVEIEGFPEIRAPADVPAALASLATAVGNGVISIEEATAAGGLLQKFLDTYETAHRLAGGLLSGKDDGRAG
jgi:hypothetical protein